MKAEEFDKKVKQFVNENKYVKEQVYGFAEAYHKAEIEKVIFDWLNRKDNEYNSNLDSFNDVARGYNMAIKDIKKQINY